MADYNYYQRPRFYKKKHPIRNFFIVLALLIVVALGVFVYIGYSDSQKQLHLFNKKCQRVAQLTKKLTLIVVLQMIQVVAVRHQANRHHHLQVLRRAVKILLQKLKNRLN